MGNSTDAGFFFNSKGDESFNATKKAVYGHLRDFAAAAEDTRRRLRVAAENIRAEIGTQMLSQSDQVRDAVNAMTDGKFILLFYQFPYGQLE